MDRPISRGRRPPPAGLQVIIQDGQILAGTLCKKTLGAAAGGLVHITWMEHGPEAARAVLSQVRAPALPSAWLGCRGYARPEAGAHACS